MSTEQLRLLVTGGSSFLGCRFVPLALTTCALRYTYFSRDPLGLTAGVPLDVRDPQAVSALVRSWQPDVIIHLAGSNLSPDMDAVIRHGTAHVSAAADAADARLVFLSTDVIFDGLSGPYAEQDPPGPLHAYGRAKVAAEQLAAKVPNHLIVRTSLIYDLEAVAGHLAWVIEGLRAGRVVTLFTNQWRNPVWTVTLGQALLELAGSSVSGILHVAGRQAMNRGDFGVTMLDWWGIEAREGLVLAHGDGSRWPADCRLDIRRAESLLSTPLLGVDDVLTMARATRGN